MNNIDFTFAPDDTLCDGNTTQQTPFACAGNDGEPNPAIHTWRGRNHCGYHSPFDNKYRPCPGHNTDCGKPIEAADALCYDCSMSRMGKPPTGTVDWNEKDLHPRPLPDNSTDLPNGGHGHWTIYRNGGLCEDMTGYGLSWAGARAGFWGRPDFVTDVKVTFSTEGHDKVTFDALGDAKGQPCRGYTEECGNPTKGNDLCPDCTTARLDRESPRSPR